MPLAAFSSSPYLTVAQAAREIGVHRKTIYEWIKRGSLVARVLPGGEYRLERSVWEEFLAFLPTSRPRAANDEPQVVTHAETPAIPPAACIEKTRARPRAKGTRNFFELGANEN